VLLFSKRIFFVVIHIPVDIRNFDINIVINICKKLYFNLRAWLDRDEICKPVVET
jgi:hypothetical protein